MGKDGGCETQLLRLASLVSRLIQKLLQNTL